MSGRVGAIRLRPREAEGSAILFADVLGLIAVVFVALDGLARGVPILARCALLAAAIVPRIAAEWIERPADLLLGRSRSLRSLLTAVLFAALEIVALTYVLDSFRWSGARMIGSPLALLCAASGAILRDRGAFRLYEPLACLTMLSGLVSGSEHGFVLVGIGFLALCLSAALRRQLAVAPAAQKPARAALRNARVAAVLITLVLMIVLLTANLGIGHAMELLGEARLRKPPPEAPKPRSEKPGDPRGSDKSTFRLTAAGAVAPPSLRRDAVPPERPGGSVDELLRITPAVQPRSIGFDDAWVPGANTLWRGWSYVRFDPAKQEWIQQSATDWVSPTGNGRLIRLNPTSTSGGATAWSLKVTAPRLAVIVLPYFTEWVNLTNAGSVRPDVLMNPDGDLFLAGDELRAGNGYDVTLRPIGDSLQLTAAWDAAASPDPAYLEVPDRAAIGIDLHAVAREAVGDESRTLLEKIRKLAAHFHDTYRYSREADPRELPDSLSEFLTANKFGDCRHLSTAAVLLLRAAGIPARLATGFKGTHKPDFSGDFVVYESSAHAWVEVMSEVGWIPVDPVQWVLEELPGLADPPEEEAAALPPPPSERRWRDLIIILSLATTIAACVLTMILRRRRTPASLEEEEQIAEEAVPAALQPGFIPRTLAEQLLVDYGGLQADLATVGHERRAYETPREHARRVSTTVPRPPKGAFDSLVPLVNDGLYGKLPITEIDLSRGRHAIEEIRRELG